MLAGAATGLLGVGVVTVALLTSGDHSRQRPLDRVSTTVPALTETATPEVASPEPTETEAATPEPTPAAVRAVVRRTCGRNGVGGDCHLSVRAEPRSGSAELDRLAEGDSLRLECQVRGESVHSSVLGASSTVWSRTTSGGYVSNVYVSGSTITPRRITLPRC